MEDYIKWLENKIEVCLEDKDLQREHWAFCQALKKYRELALRQPPVSGSVLSNEEMREPIEDALYATQRFLTTEATDLAEGILEYIKDAGFTIVHTDR